YFITDFLRIGKNVIAIEDYSPADPAGVIVECTLNYEDGSVEIFATDSSWKFSPTFEENWQELDFDDSHWRNAVELGKPPIAPWFHLPFRYMGQDQLEWELIEIRFPHKVRAGEVMNIELKGKILSLPKGNNLGFLRIRRGGFILFERKSLHPKPPISQCKVGDVFNLFVSFVLPKYSPGGKYVLEMGLHRSKLSEKEGFDLGEIEVMEMKSELPKAEIRDLNGSPALFINGKPFFPMVYSQIPFIDEKHVQQFTKAGIELYEINHVLGEFIRRGWKGPGKYDFSEFDDLIFKLLRVNPNAYFFPRLWLEPPDWWIQTHPDELQLYADGTGWDKSDQFGGTKWPSFASQIWLKEEGEALRKFVEHIQSSPYAERCIGFHIGAGIYGEWHYMGAQYVPDMSEPMKKAFRNWLKEKYRGDLEALRKAWGKEDVTFENAEIPNLEERLKTSFGMFHHPANNRQVVDYYMCHHKVLVDAILNFARIVKEASKGRSLVGVFFGYTSNMLWPQDGGHIELRRVLTSPYVDFLCSPHTYVGRALGQDGGFRALPGSVALHHKIFKEEADDGTHLAPGVAQARNADESIALMRREFSQALSINGGLWWFDMASCWFDDYQLMKDIALMKTIGDKSLSLPRKRMSEVAVIVGLNSFYYTAHWRSGKDTVTDLLLNDQWRELFKMGAPFDLYDISDIEEMPQYKCYIFLNTFFMDERTRKAVAKLKEKGGLFIWFYAPGLLNERDIDVRNMEEITGMKMNLSLEPKILEVHMENGKHWSNGKETSPFIFLNDSEVVVLGHSKEGKPTFALKRFPKWTSVYILTPPAPASVLRELLRAEGIHIYLDTEDVLFLNQSFLAIHTAKEGSKRISLPSEREIEDAFSGEKIGRVKELTVQLPAHRTVLYLLR
ncbi:beta-galactosidase, partial [bacterium]|nr:beta-galactosidase [bacterium]